MSPPVDGEPRRSGIDTDTALVVAILILAVVAGIAIGMAIQARRVAPTTPQAITFIRNPSTDAIEAIVSGVTQVKG